MAGPDGPGERAPHDSTGRDGPDLAPSPPPPPSVVIVHRRPPDELDSMLPDGAEPGLPPDAMDPDRATRSVRRAIDQLVGQIEGGLADRRDEDRS
jgi:hypothetical protein